MKYLVISFILMCLLFCGESPAQSIQRTEEHRATNAEEKEARDLAIKFTIDFAETQDLTPLIKDLYFRDFVERYKGFKTKALNNKHVDLYFAPGLEYSSQLLTTADSTDWKDFYVATNNFLLLGYISGLKNISDETQDIKATDLYPSEVIELLHTNPALANMIERKESGKSVGTVGEVKAATATLSQAVAMIREKNKGRPLISKKDELTEVMMHDEVFKPRVEVLDDNYFGFPKNTRILFINTAIGLQLMLAKDTDRLRIFWTEIISN